MVYSDISTEKPGSAAAPAPDPDELFTLVGAIPGVGHPVPCADISRGCWRIGGFTDRAASASISSAGD